MLWKHSLQRNGLRTQLDIWIILEVYCQEYVVELVWYSSIFLSVMCSLSAFGTPKFNIIYEPKTESKPGKTSNWRRTNKKTTNFCKKKKKNDVNILENHWRLTIAHFKCHIKTNLSIVWFLLKFYKKKDRTYIIKTYTCSHLHTRTHIYIKAKYKNKNTQGLRFCQIASTKP